MNMFSWKKFSLLVLVCICLAVAVSCGSDAANYVEVRFSASEMMGKAISTGEGTGSVQFSDLTSHKIKLVCSEGTGYCSLSGAKDGFVSWPTSPVRLGYGEWTVYAEGYKDSDKLYENTEGVTFLVGPSGISLDGGTTWGSSVSIKESFCGVVSSLVRASSSLVVKDESSAVISLGDGAYSDYKLLWMKSSVQDPANVSNAVQVSDLQPQFSIWADAAEGFELSNETYVLVAIVKGDTPTRIYGSACVSLDSLASGYNYTIGGGESDYVQFGQYAVTFSTPSKAEDSL